VRKPGIEGKRFTIWRNWRIEAVAVRENGKEVGGCRRISKKFAIIGEVVIMAVSLKKSRLKHLPATDSRTGGFTIR
jgi:hypothetical protein